MIRKLRSVGRFAITVVLAISMLVGVLPSPSEAKGTLRTLTKIYTGQKIARTAPATIRRAVLVRKYLRELHGASGNKITRKQFSHLRTCMQSSSCLTNRAPWTNKARKDAIAGWVSNVGKGKWPSYRKDYMFKGAQLKKGTNWDAHHVIPKALGGPHAWWNVVPSRRPSHLGYIHR